MRAGEIIDKYLAETNGASGNKTVTVSLVTARAETKRERVTAVKPTSNF